MHGSASAETAPGDDGHAARDFGARDSGESHPSALVVTIALLNQPKPAARVFAYAAGIFVVFFSLGVAAVLGGDGVLTFFKDLRGRHFAYVLQLPIGLGLIGWVWWWLKRPPVLDRPSRLSNPPKGPVWAFSCSGLA